MKSKKLGEGEYIAHAQYMRIPRFKPQYCKTNKRVDGCVRACVEVPVSELLVGMPHSCCVGGVSNYLLSDEVFAVWLSGSDSPVRVVLWAQLS